ncbi:hypothetical protein [Nocardioides sp. KR10-350]|uniref:hypothetical protein n=1 Tax=Nocardioides cheoyonin TaxID=3156615 RepID=UPI0032B33234
MSPSASRPSRSGPPSPGRSATPGARSSDALEKGAFGVRAGGTDLARVGFPATADYTERALTVRVPAGVDEITVYAGFDGPGSDTWLQPDDVSVEETS